MSARVSARVASILSFLPSDRTELTRSFCILPFRGSRKFHHGPPADHLTHHQSPLQQVSAPLSIRSSSSACSAAFAELGALTNLTRLYLGAGFPISDTVLADTLGRLRLLEVDAAPLPGHSPLRCATRVHVERIY